MDKLEDVIKLISSSNACITVSRSKLISASLYYERLISSGMKDSNSKELKLSLLSSDGLDAVAEYLQTGSVQGLNDLTDVFSLERLKRILEAGSYLQIDSLLCLCKERLKSVVSLHLWKPVLDLASDYYLRELMIFVLKYLCDNFSDCSKTTDFLLLSKNDILAILNSDETDAEEPEIFSAALSWTSFHESRSPDASEVFRAVRYPLMNDIEIENCLQILSAHGLHDVRTQTSAEVQSFKSDKQLKCAAANKKTKLRCTMKAILATGGFTSKEHSTSRLQLLPLLHVENERKRNHELLPSEEPSGVVLLSCKNEKLPATVCEHGACVVNNILYIAGGQHQYCKDGRYTTNAVYCFDPGLAVWSMCASMHVPRSLFYFGELDGSLYAVTGCTAPNTDTPSVERYSPLKDKWEMLNSVTIEVHELAGCNHNGILYISGGFRGPDRGHVDLVWSYKKTEDIWEQRASMTTARSYHAMASAGAYIIVVGGVKILGGYELQDIQSCEVYNPEFDQWTVVAQLEHVASCMSHVEVNGTMFLFGGHSFEQDCGHNFLQIIDLHTFKSYSVTFTAHKISYFETAILDLPKKYVKKFH